MAPDNPKTNQLLEAYSALDLTVDEMIDTDGSPRSHWQQLVSELERLSPAELAERQAATNSAIDLNGVTYYSDPTKGRNRWRVDALPFILPDTEWNSLELGIKQRSELLNLILEDLYGPRRLINSGALPVELLFSDPTFLRSNDGIKLPGEKQLFLASVDLLRDSTGAWSVLDDRTQVPSGASYAMENRAIISQIFPRLFRRSNTNQIWWFFDKLRSGLANVAPAGVDEPRAVVLSPGHLSETAFEHAALAAELGIPLVEGSDLTMQDGAIWLRSVSGRRQVHIIVRRVDGWYCDPLELRGDSRLGVAGLNEACRQGTVSVVNPIGSGVIENRGLTRFLPELCRKLLGEDLLVPNTPVWWCGNPNDRAYVFDNLESLVVRPTSRLVDFPSVPSDQLSEAGRDDLRRRIEDQPHLWVGQTQVEPSTVPTLTDHGLRPRNAVLRSFAVADSSDYFVMAGGLTRVADSAVAASISSRQGATSKDTWIVSESSHSGGGPELVDVDLGGGAQNRSEDPAANLPARTAENLFWLGRYAERAEAAARLVRAVDRRRIDFQDSRPGPGREALDILLRTVSDVTGTSSELWAEGADFDKPANELFDLIVNNQRPGAIRHSIDQLMLCSEFVRDQMSGDNWLVVGTLQQFLVDASQSQFCDPEESIGATLSRILTDLLALSGIGAESLVRDPAWCYLDVGRRLERAIQTLRLIRASWFRSTSQQTEKLVVLSVLSACESATTYRRRYQLRARVSSALDLLLIARDNPRSVQFQLDQLEADLKMLARLRPLATDSGEIDRLFGTTKHQLNALSVTELELPDAATGQRLLLADSVDGLNDTLDSFAHQLAAEHFPRLLPHQPLVLPNILRVGS